MYRQENNRLRPEKRWKRHARHLGAVASSEGPHLGSQEMGGQADSNPSSLVDDRWGLFTNKSAREPLGRGASSDSDISLVLDASASITARSILSTALTLSLVTLRPFRIIDFRGDATDSGVRPGDVALIQAAARFGVADVQGNLVGSRNVEFRPTECTPRDLVIDLGPEGSAPWLVQTLHLPLALRAKQASRLTVYGEVHPVDGPSFASLNVTWREHLTRMGAPVSLGMPKPTPERESSGILDAWIEPANLRWVDWTTRGPLSKLRALVEFSKVDRGVAEQLKTILEAKLRRAELEVDIGMVERNGVFAQPAVHLIAAHDNGPKGPTSATFTGIVREDNSPEAAAVEAVHAFLGFERRIGAAVDSRAAGKLALSLAFAEGRSKFTTPKISGELRAIAPIMEAFLPERLITLVEEFDDQTSARVVVS